MYMVESLPVSRALDAQEDRVRHQCSQLKVIRNQDDLVSRKLKAEVNSLQKRTKYASGDGDFDELKRISELDKSESGQQGSLTPRGGVRRAVISHTIDIPLNDRSPVMSENLSSSDSPIHIPKKINRTQTSTIANQQDYKQDKSGARNSPARMMSQGPAMPKKSYQKGVSMVPGSKYLPDNIEIMNEIHQLHTKIKVKKYTLYFYDTIEKTLEGFLVIKNSQDLNSLMLSKLIYDLRIVLRENKITMQYMIGMLDTELNLRKQLLQTLEKLQEKYRARADDLAIRDKKDELRTSKSHCKLAEVQINPLIQKELDSALKDLAVKREPLRNAMSVMLSQVREYIELKESLYGVNIGDEQSIFEYFIRQVLDGGEEIQRAIDTDSVIEEKSIESSIESEDPDNLSDQIIKNEEITCMKRRHSEDFDKRENEYQNTLCNIEDQNLKSQRKNISEDPFETYQIKETHLTSDNKKVYLVQERETKLYYTLEMTKIQEYGFNLNINKPFSNKENYQSLQDFVVRVTSEFKYKDMHCYLRETMKHGSLRSFLKNHLHSLNQDQIISIIGNLLLCIEHLHSHRFISKKINLDTVLVGEDGHLKLAGLGRPTLMASSLSVY